MKPLGTPPLIGYSCQHFSSRTTRRCRLPTNELLRPITQAEIPQDLILWRKAACQTLSNLSSATVQIGPRLLKDLTIPWDHGMPPIEEGGGWGLNLRFYWGIFLPEEGDWTRNDCGHSILLWCLKQHSVNIEHQQNKISIAYVYIKPEVKKMIQQQWLQLKMKLVLGDYCIKSVIWWGQNETPPKKNWDGKLVLKNGSSSC